MIKIYIYIYIYTNGYLMREQKTMKWGRSFIHLWNGSAIIHFCTADIHICVYIYAINKYTYIRWPSECIVLWNKDMYQYWQPHYPYSKATSPVPIIIIMLIARLGGEKYIKLCSCFNLTRVPQKWIRIPWATKIGDVCSTHSGILFVQRQYQQYQHDVDSLPKPMHTLADNSTWTLIRRFNYILI